MMNFSTEEILSKMQETGMIPVFFHPDPEIASNIVKSAYEGGVRVFEFTNRGPEAFDVFKELRRTVDQYEDAILGIGTIMNAANTRKYISAGADFIVSPVLKPEMARECSAEKIMWIPGCATLTEIVNAHDDGAELIKLFPASVLGPAFVSAVRPVIPSIRLMPTGGVDVSAANLKAWFDAGVFCVGMGSQLIPQEYIKGESWSELKSSVASVMHTISSVRVNKLLSHQNK